MDSCKKNDDEMSYEKKDNEKEKQEQVMLEDGLEDIHDYVVGAKYLNLKLSMCFLDYLAFVVVLSDTICLIASQVTMSSMRS